MHRRCCRQRHRQGGCAWCRAGPPAVGSSVRAAAVKMASGPPERAVRGCWGAGRHHHRANPKVVWRARAAFPCRRILSRFVRLRRRPVRGCLAPGHAASARWQVGPRGRAGAAAAGGQTAPGCACVHDSGYLRPRPAAPPTPAPSGQRAGAQPQQQPPPPPPRPVPLQAPRSGCCC